MLNGIRMRAYPTALQRQILSQWMGCARTIWNAKCEDEKYMTRFARKYCPIGTYAPIDQTFAQYKNKELTPWLYQCPSQILRNSAVNWYQTYWKFIKGECGKPKRKKYTGNGSVHLTKELFSFKTCKDGNIRLFIGTKRNNIGFLSFKKHRFFSLPQSIYIKKQAGRYTVSFCYEQAKSNDLSINLAWLKGQDEAWLNAHTIGIDRGIQRPVQAGDIYFDFSKEQKRNKEKHKRTIKRLSKRLARQQKKSKHREKTRLRIVKHHQKISNIRDDFCHQTSHRITSNETIKVIILEDLKTRQMTKKAKPKRDKNGQYIKNQASAKRALNHSILDKGWHQLEQFLSYKARNKGKVLFKVSAQYTSLACAVCDHTHPNNRQSQSIFLCGNCGNEDNADRNASYVIKKRGIQLILDSGTELSKRGVLTPCSGIGRGAEHKTSKAHAIDAAGVESSKKKRTATQSLVSEVAV